MEKLRESIEHAISLELQEEKTYSVDTLSSFIEGLYVFDENGVLIYSKNFTENKIEPGLVSGFFSAIQTFTSNMISEKEKLQEITLEERKLIFKNLVDEKIVIMAITRKNMEWDSKKILEKISSDINYVLKHTKVNINMLGYFLNKYIDEVLVKRLINN